MTPTYGSPSTRTRETPREARMKPQSRTSTSAPECRRLSFQCVCMKVGSSLLLVFRCSLDRWGVGGLNSYSEWSRVLEYANAMK